MDAATWLNTTFARFDHALLQAAHQMRQCLPGGAADGAAKLLDWFGTGGLGLILLGVLLLCFRRTRRTGAAVLLALALGALVTNVILKPLVARPRPYEASELFRQWWLAAGGELESDRSFPSGHTTAAMAAMTALFWMGDKRYSWTAFLFALAMGLSRLCLAVHYPTDVLAGLLVGLAAGTAAARIVRRVKTV